jgi:G3E family GTPase
MISSFIPVSIVHDSRSGDRGVSKTNLSADGIFRWTERGSWRGRRAGWGHGRVFTGACHCRQSVFLGLPVTGTARMSRQDRKGIGFVSGPKMTFSVVLPAFSWSADLVDSGGGFPAPGGANEQDVDAPAQDSSQAPPQEQTPEADERRRLLRSTPVPTIVLSGLDDVLRLQLLGLLLRQILRMSSIPEKQSPRVGIILPTSMANQLGLEWNEQEADWRVTAATCTEALQPSLCSIFGSDQIYYQVSDHCTNRTMLLPKVENLLKRRARDQAQETLSASDAEADSASEAEKTLRPVNIFEVQAAYGMDYIFICSPEKEEPHTVAETLAQTTLSLQLYALVSIVDAATTRGIFGPTLRRAGVASALGEPDDPVASSEAATTPVAPAGNRDASLETTATQGSPGPGSAEALETASRVSDRMHDPKQDSEPQAPATLETPLQQPVMDRQRGSSDRAQADNLVQLLVDQIEYANVVVVYDENTGRGSGPVSVPAQTCAEGSFGDTTNPGREPVEQPTTADPDVLRYLRLLNCEAQIITMNDGQEWPQTLLERVLERPFEAERLLWMPTWRRVLASYAAAELAKTTPAPGPSSSSSAEKGAETTELTASAPNRPADTPATASVAASASNTAIATPFDATANVPAPASQPKTGPEEVKATAQTPTASGAASPAEYVAREESTDAVTTSKSYGSWISNEHFLAALYSGARPWERGLTAAAMRPETCFLYRADRPFHPRRLFDRISNISTFHGVLRSVGKLWLANRMDSCLEWSQVGNNITLKRGPRFFVTLPVEQWPTAPDSRDPLRPVQWDDRFGDRCSEIVFLGEDLDPARLQVELDECLLRDEELVFTEAWNEFEDPFASLVPNVESSRASDAMPSTQKSSFLERLASQIPAPWKLTLFTDARQDAKLDQTEHIISPGDVVSLPAKQGVVLVCGTPGAGKSSLLEAIADREDVEVWRRLSRPVASAFQTHTRAQAIAGEEIDQRLAKHPRPFRLYIETDWPLAGADAMITVVDCLRFRSSDPIQQQLVEAADTVVLSKSDLISAQRLAQVLEYLCSWNPQARVVRSMRCHVQHATVWVQRQRQQQQQQQPPASTDKTHDERFDAAAGADSNDDTGNGNGRPASAPRTLSLRPMGREPFQRYHLHRKRLMDISAFLELLRLLHDYTDTLYATGYMRPAETVVTLPIEFDGVHVRIYSRPVMSANPQLSMDLVLYADGIEFERLRSFSDDVIPDAEAH